MSTKQLSRRQARWAEFLSEFNFIIKYRPGVQGTKPDSLTRRTGDVPDGVDDDRIQQQQQQLLKDHMYEKPPKGVEVATILLPMDDGSEYACYLAHVINDTLEIEVANLACLMYDLSEETCSGDSEELLTVALDRSDDGGDELKSDWEPATHGDSHNAREPDAERESLAAEDVIKQVREATLTDDVIQRIITCKDEKRQRLPLDLMKAGVKLDLASCRHEDGLLYLRDRVFVPDDDALRAKIISLYHETRTGGHGGRHATYEKIARHYFWPHMTDTVARYTRNCLICQRSKPFKEGRHGLLNPLPIPDTYWNSISVDFITPLPPTTYYGRTYNHIMVVVDRLSKKKKFVPLQSLDVEAVVQAFIECIWREEGYPAEVISDRGAQFTSHFWKRLCERIGTRPKLSSSHHPETDGQTEIANAALKQFLRAFVHYDQGNWAELLPFAEFQANNSVSTTTGVTPFYATKGYHPRSGMEPPTTTPPLGWKAARDSKAADALVKRISDVKEFLAWNASWAQAKMEEQANRHRLPSPEWREGDYVMLDARNVRTRQHSKGLSPKNLGPFKVLASYKGRAYKLDFSDHDDLRTVYPVFHPWLLHAVEGKPLPGQRQVPQGPVDVSPEGDSYEINDILDSKLDRRSLDPATGKKGLLKYLVKWSGYDKPDWIQYTDATGCLELIHKYHERHPNVALPPGLRSIVAHEEHMAYLWIE